jgi:purine-nucleoside phosphorylase
MGQWAKNLFGKEQFSNIGIVMAGTATQEFEKKILSYFDEIISSKDSVYHAYLVKKKNKLYPIVFNIYGAPAMVEVATLMHDGGCKNIIFIGYAYGGLGNLNVGEVVISDKAYHFEGIYHKLDSKRDIDYPDKKLMKQIVTTFNKSKIKYQIGSNISVPSVFFQPNHANEIYKKIKPLTLEMELASCYSQSKDIGVRCAGILIISDTKKIRIDDKNKKIERRVSKDNVLKAIIKNIEKFNIPALKVKKEYNIDEHLAEIIHDPEDKTNAYKKQ